MDYLEELIHRTWRIAWSCAPLVLLAAVVLRRDRLRPVVAHAVALGAGLAFLLPLVLPVRRHVFELPRAGGAVPAEPPLASWTEIPLPWWLVLAVSGTLVVAHFGRELAFRRRVASHAPVPVHVQAQVDRLAREVGLGRPPDTVWCADPVGPLVRWGWRRHRMLLPRGRWSDWSARQREVVLLHELAHLRRRDGPAQALWAIVTLFYWWNPLVWYLRRVSNDAAELACDRWATELRDASRETYARALLALAADRCRPSRTPGVHILAGEKHRLGRRLRSILHDVRAPASAWPAVAVVAATLCLGCGLTAGQIGALETRHSFDAPTDVRAFLEGEPSAEVRRRAVDALGNGAPGVASWSVPLLVELFPEEPSASVRYEIIDALARLDASDGTEALVSRAASDPSARVRRRAAELAER